MAILLVFYKLRHGSLFVSLVAALIRPFGVSARYVAQRMHLLAKVTAAGAHHHMHFERHALLLRQTGPERVGRLPQPGKTSAAGSHRDEDTASEITTPALLLVCVSKSARRSNLAARYPLCSRIGFISAAINGCGRANRTDLAM